jgi:hypothetical protein
MFPNAAAAAADIVSAVLTEGRWMSGESRANAFLNLGK